MERLERAAVGNVIRKLRQEKELTQEVLSGLIGIGRSHLAMIETGTKLPNLDTIWRIALAMSMHPHEIIRLIETECVEIESKSNLSQKGG